MRKIRNEKGFTLIELAIVLVIIGIILGAVLKGQDLMDNARAKKFTTEVKSWEVAVYNFYDRKGYFPGDSGRSGIIGDNGSESVTTDMAAANFVSAPTRTFQIGQSTFSVFFGSDGNATTPRNIMAICANDACTNVFSQEALKYAEAFDTSIDGAANATNVANTKVYGISAGITPDSTRGVASLTTGGTVAGNTDWLQNANLIAVIYKF